MSKELEKLYTPIQSLNNIRNNYFNKQRNEDDKLEYFWFDRVETALKALEIIKKFGLEIHITEKNAFVTSNTIKGIFSAYIYITDKKDEIELLKSLKEVLL